MATSPSSQPPQLQLHEQYSPADTPPSSSSAPPPKKKRSLPGAPNKYPDAEVIALSPKTLMATNRFICEVCNKGFQREQNLQLHRRGHNLPWKLKQKNSKEPVRKKVYLCPEPTCVHHDPTRALGDLTGIKKHYFRKHGEKKFKCEKCAKRYAVLSDWKAHSKTCGTKEYSCECGTKFSRRDSFTTHRAFCDVLNQESNRLPASLPTIGTNLFCTNGGGVAGNNMGLGMGLSNQLANHHPSMSGQQMTAEILRLGGGVQQIDRLLSTPLRSDQHQNNIQPPQQNFSRLSNQLRSNQGGGGGGYEYGGHDQNQRLTIGGGIFSSKLFHRQENELPEFQGNAYTLGFSPNNNNSNSNSNNNNADTSTLNSGSTGSRDHSSALFSSSGGNDLFSGPPHMSSDGGLSTLYNTDGGPVHQQQSAMSATALLQKAAQMGSTNSTTNASVNALLKGFLSNPPPQSPSPPTNDGGGFGGLYGENNQNNLHDLLIQNLSRDNNMSENNNYYTGFNPNNKSTQGGISAGLSDHMTRDFLGVGEVVRSMNGEGGFTANQGGGNGIWWWT